MKTGEPTFTELLQRARTGDTAAMDLLAQIYAGDLLIAARVHLGPALRPYLDSIDLVQSVHRSLLLGLRSNKHSIADPGALIALALTMVRRKIARQWRRHRRQSRLADEHSGVHPTDVLATISCRDPTPAAAAEVRDAIARLWRELDEDDRQLLELRLAGLSPAEAAEKLGKSPGALRVRLHRLRQRLADEQILSEWL
jgi:RNA polymerase sigma-70 factor (ECF subfamily)